MIYAPRFLKSNAQGPQKRRGLSAKLFGGLVGRYRAIRKRLSEMLGRGDPDYATMSGLSQEIGRMRQMIRKDREQRRRERKDRKDRLNDSLSATRTPKTLVGSVPPE